MVLQPTKYTRLSTANMKEQDNIVKIRAEFAQPAFSDSKIQKEQIFTPEYCYNIFRNIKDEDVDFLGLSSKESRPEWMIIKSLPVPPPNVRPSIRQSDNQRSEDDLSYGLSMIIKANKALKQLMENNGKLFLLMDSVISSTKPQLHSLFQVVFIIPLLSDIPIQIYLYSPKSSLSFLSIYVS
jgi:DNA-directed RNA polymerase beta' subunit